MAAPFRLHQAVLGRLHLSVGTFLAARPELGQVYLGPFDVVFSMFDVVEPDLLFVAADQVEILTEKNVQGAAGSTCAGRGDSVEEHAPARRTDEASAVSARGRPRVLDRRYRATHGGDSSADDARHAVPVGLAVRTEALVGPRSGWPAGSAAVEAEAAVLEARKQYVQAAGVYEKTLSTDPAFLHGHIERVRLLPAAGRADRIGPSLQAARTAARADLTSRGAAGAAYWELSYRTPGLAPAAAQALLAEAVTLFDEALALDPDHLETLVHKSLALRQQARHDTDPARAKRLTEQADRLRERAETLMRNRQP